ncbi:ABC transporter substrate-binding protein [Frankia sp. AgPm24]|uniref:ABC transporter substrate-binding protein n=1 Tax=Frankia sp. AgPm24 TaxID=631128 RepID=UPI00200C799E|nr:ABC transporter substrate-binding protein [Frankia sp. AgPm24]MCK9923690.1 ABC transporter substrate-binding protein [Frankia sp. AgPm24]
MKYLTGHGPATALSRRSFLASVSAGAVALGLTACGDDSTGSTGGASTTATTGFPLTIRGAEGDTVLKTQPQRIVTVGFERDTDEAVSLGVLPVAITPATNFDSGLPPWVEARLTGKKAPEQLSYEDNLPFERIAALRPDLILATDSYSLSDDFKNLTAIAPTLSYDKDVSEDTWQTRVTRIGQALGRDAEAKRLVDTVTAQIAEAKKKNQALFAGRTFTFSLLNAEGALATVVSPDDASAQFLAGLGLTLSSKVTSLPPAGPAGRAVVSEERTELLDADIVLFSFRDDDEKAQIQGNRLFQALPAVTRGSYVPLDTPTALSMAFPSTLSIPFALTNIVPKLSAAAGRA